LGLDAQRGLGAVPRWGLGGKGQSPDNGRLGQSPQKLGSFACLMFNVTSNFACTLNFMFERSSGPQPERKIVAQSTLSVFCTDGLYFLANKSNKISREVENVHLNVEQEFSSC